MRTLGGVECVACGTAIELAPGVRVGLRDTCPSCGADLHRCVQCRHYEPGAYNDCREPNAERVVDPERANRCDWFAIGEKGAGSDPEASRQEALSQLDALFKKTE